MAWTYSNWITQATTALEFSQLKLHIQEVSDFINTKFQSQGAVGQSAARYQMQQYLDGLMKRYDELRSALGLDPAASVEPFVQLKPLTDDGLAEDDDA